MIQGGDEAARGVVILKDLILGAKIAEGASLEEWKSRPAQVEVPPGKWWITDAGETEATATLLEAFHAAGASGGRILTEGGDEKPAENEVVFSHETTARHSTDAVWPMFQFSAVLRKHHPYTELLPRLTGAAIS